MYPTPDNDGSYRTEACCGNPADDAIFPVAELRQVLRSRRRGPRHAAQEPGCHCLDRGIKRKRGLGTFVPNLDLSS